MKEGEREKDREREIARNLFIVTHLVEMGALLIQKWTDSRANAQRLARAFAHCASYRSTYISIHDCNR